MKIKSLLNYVAVIIIIIAIASCSAEPTPAPKSSTTTATNYATIKVTVQASDLASSNDCEIDKKVKVTLSDNNNNVIGSSIQNLSQGDFEEFFKDLTKGSYTIDVYYAKTSSSSWYYKNEYSAYISDSTQKVGGTIAKTYTLNSDDICY